MNGLIIAIVLFVGVVCFYFMPKTCDICGVSLLSRRKKVFYIKHEGKNLHLCANCNRSLERKISKLRFDNFTEHSMSLREDDYDPNRRSTGVSVTKFVKSIQQPRGGFIKVNDMVKEVFDDNFTLSENENISPIIVGLAVDYLTRLMIFKDKESAFSIALKGAELAGERDNARKLLFNINELDRLSVISACKLSGYDVVYRKGLTLFKGVDKIEPDNDTTQNIQIMVKRAVLFFQNSGVIESEITFEGGYSDAISSGDGDYLSKDTLWDMKVTKNEPNKDHTLQLLIYTILLSNSDKYKDTAIKTIGIFNPRKNKSYVFHLTNVDKTSYETVYQLIYK